MFMLKKCQIYLIYLIFKECWRIYQGFLQIIFTGKKSGSKILSRHFAMSYNMLRKPFPLYRNQSTDVENKSIDWFLYEENGGHS